jgi:hypothetical protein
MLYGITKGVLARNEPKGRQKSIKGYGEKICEIYSLTEGTSTFMQETLRSKGNFEEVLR